MTNHFNEKLHSTIANDGEQGTKEQALTKKAAFTEKGEEEVELYEEMLVFFTGRTKSERSRKERSITFPLRLMYALECGKFSDIINWKVDAANQHCIQIHDTAALSKEVLPSLFKVAKFESFQRKLYRWGFIKHRPSKKKSSSVTFVNPAFRQGDYVNAAKISCSPKKNFRPDPNEILRIDSLGGVSTFTGSFNPSIMRIDDTQPVVMNNDVQKVTPPPATSMMPGLNVSSNDSFASSVPSLHSSSNMNTFMSNANNARNANLLKMSDLAQSMSNPMFNNNTLQTQTGVQTPTAMLAMPDHYHGTSMRHQMIIQNALNALHNDIRSNNGGMENLNQNILMW